MKVVIDWSRYMERLEDIVDLVEKHAKSGHIKGSEEILVIEEPDEFLISELKRRMIEYKEE